MEEIKEHPVEEHKSSRPPSINVAPTDATGPPMGMTGPPMDPAGMMGTAMGMLGPPMSGMPMGMTGAPMHGMGMVSEEEENEEEDDEVMETPVDKPAFVYKQFLPKVPSTTRISAMEDVVFRAVIEVDEWLDASKLEV